MLDITEDMFREWPIVVFGTLIEPTFSTSHLVAICGSQPIPSSSTLVPNYISEGELYKWLESIGNEFSCKLFYYIANTLNSLRKNAAATIGAYFIRNNLYKSMNYTQKCLTDYESRVACESDMRDVTHSMGTFGM